MALQVFEKTSGLKTKTPENGRRIFADCAALSISYRPTHPIDQLQIVSQGKADAIAVRVFVLLDQGYRLGFARRWALLPYFTAVLADTLLDGDKVRRFGCFCDSSAYRVKVDIAHAGEYGGFIEQRLALESSFPETTFTVVFTIDLPG
jgi:hypothetical protein